jgi:uncharacterized RDD family membrane protein YckC
VTSKAVAQAMQFRRAGITTRVLADAIDLGVIFVIYAGVLVAIGVVDYLATSGSFHIADPGPALAAAGLLAIQIIYLAAGWSGVTRSVGKEMMGLRVLHDDGRMLSFRYAFVRSIVCTFIGQPLLLWSAVSKRNAAVYDLFLKTSVVYDWRSPAQILKDEGVGLSTAHSPVRV